MNKRNNGVEIVSYRRPPLLRMSPWTSQLDVVLAREWRYRCNTIDDVHGSEGIRQARGLRVLHVQAASLSHSSS